MYRDILTKAIEKALRGGWMHEPIPISDGEELFTSVSYWSQQDYRTFVYRHEFAKALWPEDTCECGSMYAAPHSVSASGKITVHKYVNDWRYHLQRMVIADNPIKYLGDNI